MQKPLNPWDKPRGVAAECLGAPGRKRRGNRFRYVEQLEDRTLLSLSLAPEYVPDEILLGFEGDVAAAYGAHGASAGLAAAIELVGSFGLERGSVLLAGQAELATRWHVSPDVNLPELITRLSKLPGLSYAEPNYFVHAATVPNDPRFAELWGLQNTGQTAGTADADIDAPLAWDITTGNSSVVVGVIDSGVDYTHPDLAANIWTNPDEIAGDGVDNDGNGYIDDVHGWDFVNNDNDPFDDAGHGTHVAGTIAAVGNNLQGVAGVNWNAKIMALKFLDASGNGTDADAIAAINYATMMHNRGVNVVLTNNSWGGGFSQSLKNAIGASGDANMLFVASANNNNTDTDVSPIYPSSYDLPNIISVAATDASDARASFSNYGATSVDLAAPGVGILSTVPTAGSLGDPSGYRILNGTSMAAPHVSGVAALAWGIAPSATYQMIRDAIFAGVDPVASMAGITVTGGRLNAFGTLQRIGMTVRASDPATGAILSNRPTDFLLDFSLPLDATTLDASDLTVNLVPADSVTVVDADTVRFQYNTSPVTAEGLQSMHIAAGAFKTTSAGPLDPLVREWSSTLRYDSTRMQVVTTVPADQSTVALPFTTLRVQVNEAIDPSTMGIGDLVLNQGSVVGAVAIAPDTVEYTLAGMVSEGILTVVLPAGALTDSNGNPMVQYGGSLELDFGTVPVPMLTALEPQGLLVYDATMIGSIRNAADTDNFTLDLGAGQTITVAVDPASGLQPQVELFNPSGASLGSSSAAAGIEAVLQSLPVASTGTYRIVVSNRNDSTGGYALWVILNAAMESETHDGLINDSRAGAQNLDEAFLGLSSGSVAAVLGTADGFETSAAITTSYSRIGLRARIPSPGSVSSTITVADSYSVADLNVRLEITHPDVSDLTASLISPDGKRVLLFSAVGADDTANFTGTTLDDEAATNIRDAAVPFTGTFRPEGRLNVFDGFNVHGTWTLQIDDPLSNDGGKLISWGVDVTRAPASPDFYGFSLAADERATLTLTAFSGDTVELELQNDVGTTLATGASGPANARAAIKDFTAPSAGMYYAVVNGDPGAEYSIVILRGAGFEVEGNNNFASAQNANGLNSVLGAIVSPDPVFVVPGNGGLREPIDLVFGRDGSLFVSDFANGTIHGTGEVVRRYDGVTGALRNVFVSWNVPYGEGITFGPDGNLYFADGNAAVQRFDGTTGTFIDQFATRNLLEGPRKPVFGPDENLYVTNIGNDSVTRFNGVTGAFISEFVPPGLGGLDFPWGMAFGPDGNQDGAPELFVASFRTSQVLRYDGANGAFLGVFASAGSGGLSGPTMLAFGPDANADGTPELYVAAGDVLRYDGATGAFIDVYVAKGEGGLSNASGLTFGPDGSLYVISGDSVLRFNTPLHDTYKLDLGIGAQVNLATSTPLGELNGLDPRINLYDASGALVAFDDNSASDGRNARLSYNPMTATPGTYYVEVVPATASPNSSGEYILTIDFPPPPPALSIDNVGRTEGNSGTTAFNFTVTRYGDSSGVVSVDYATVDGTATTANNDYVPASGTLTFLSGETQMTVPVTVNGDAAEEDPETFFVQLSNPTSSVILLGDGRGTGTIFNDDTTVALGGDASVIEGDAGSQPAVFIVNLSKPSGLTVTVHYATLNGTATAGADYIAASGTLTFAPGETSKTISVSINGESIVESNETFFVNLTGPANATLGSAQAKGTIVNNDGNLTINFSNFKSTTGLTLVGSATKNQNKLQLTPAQAGQTGAAWFTTQQAVAAGFKTTFQFLMPGGSDGMAFVIENSSAGTSALGGGGGGLGYGGILNSLAVEFDTYDNGGGGGELGDNHVAVHTNGTGPNKSGGAYALAAAQPSFYLDNNIVHTALIDYVNGTLRVFLDGAATALLSVPIDLATTLSLASGGKAWVGFTAATGGGAYQTHNILSWQFAPLPAALLADGSPVRQFTGKGVLKDRDLRAIVREAIGRWEAASPSPGTAAALRDITIHIADLGGLALGLAAGQNIWLDDNATGWGWFVDQTPWDDREFITRGDEGEQNRMDLLTALMHEMGHTLGFDHSHDSGDVMAEFLAPGVRLVPVAGRDLPPIPTIAPRGVGSDAAESANILRAMPIADLPTEHNGVPVVPVLGEIGARKPLPQPLLAATAELGSQPSLARVKRKVPSWVLHDLALQSLDETLLDKTLTGTATYGLE